MTVAAIDRCLRLIEALAGQVEPVELVELAGKVDLPNSAAHRILSTLLSNGWVVQDPVSQKYALSLRLSTFAFRNLDARGIPDVAQSALDDLAARTKEYCRLAIVEGEDLIWVARAQGATVGLRYEPDMGQEIVLHATASGKAWLATLPEAEALRIACANGFEANRPLGPNAVGDIDELRDHLADTRSRGFAAAIEEGESGTVALAISFQSSNQSDAPVVGTISVAGPLSRMGSDRFAALAAELSDAARRVEEIWTLRSRQRGRLTTKVSRAPRLHPRST